MLPVDAEADFLEQVYDAAVAPEGWGGVLERLARIMDGASANLTFQDQVTGGGRALSWGTDAKLFDTYFGYFATRNPLLKIRDFPLALRVITDEDKLPKEELVRGEYYNDFLKRMEAHSILIFRLAIENSNTTVLNVVRPASREPFRGRDIENANRLLPHLVRAFRVSSHVSNMEKRSGSFETFADASASALFVVDGNGTLLHANRAAETMAAARRGLTIRHGVLRAVEAHDGPSFAALIGAAGTADREKRSSGAMSLGRPGRKGRITVTVTPARTSLAADFRSSSCVLVCATDPQAGVAVSERRLGELFALTRAESRIALQLMEGRGARDVASALGLSYNTVRAHLARIYAKTGAHRQAELVRMLSRAV